MNVTKEKFTQISQTITSDPRIQEFARPGCCRNWSGLSISVLRELKLDDKITLEAREVYFDPSLSHTFLRAVIDNVSYLLDGTGVLSHPPFFGLEIEAPTHLQGSIPDGLINTQFEIECNH